MMSSEWPSGEEIIYDWLCLSNAYSYDDLWQEVSKSFYSLETIAEQFTCPVALYKNCNYIIIFEDLMSARGCIASILEYCVQKERHFDYI